jgi:glucosyl-3-phosphoglycerate synthase
MSYLKHIEEWLKNNSYTLDDFSNLNKLEELKKNLNYKVSVVIPTLEEEDTIENVINYLIRKLVIQNKIIDEIVVIDGGSKDSTIDKILKLKENNPDEVKFFLQDDILPTICKHKGKGEALWKSLYVTEGDIIIYSDSDIKNFDERFVVGILGPLLVNNDIKFVKGYYNRPLITSNESKSNEGGRVTELCARPLLNVLYPELSGFIQPLGGEYGGFREVLEKVEYTSGYGVEVQTLIEIYEKFGLDVMAQTNLIERVHRHQPLNSLSKMSSAIMQTILKRKLSFNKLNSGILIKNVDQENTFFTKSRTDGQVHCNTGGEVFGNSNFKFANINETTLPQMANLKKEEVNDRPRESAN